jgi:tetratricopeptide (TPR) repeat protein
MQVLLKSFVFALLIGIVLFQGHAPRKPEEFYARGVVRLEQGDLEGAMADFNKAIELLPKYSAAISARVSVKSVQGDLEGALADYGRAIELTPDIAIPYYSRGFILLEQEDFDAAIKDFDKAIETQPGVAIVYRNRADARRAKGGPDPGMLALI